MEVEATTAELFKFAQPSFTSKIVNANQVAAFLRDKDYLLDL